MANILRSFITIESLELPEYDVKAIEHIHVFGVKVLETMHIALAKESYLKWMQQRDLFTTSVRFNNNNYSSTSSEILQLCFEIFCL
jgi:hypothetical protein